MFVDALDYIYVFLVYLKKKNFRRQEDWLKKY